MKYTAAVAFCFVAFVGSSLGRHCGSNERKEFWKEWKNATDNCTKLGECEQQPCFKGESDDPKNPKCVQCVVTNVKLFIPANGTFNRTRIGEVFGGKKDCIVNCVESAEAQTKDSLVLVQQVLQCVNAEGCFKHKHEGGHRNGGHRKGGHRGSGEVSTSPSYDGTAYSSTPRTDDPGESFDDESSDDESPFDEGEESGSGSHER